MHESARRLRLRPGYAWAACTAVVCMGCQLFEPPDAAEQFETILHAARPSRGSVGLEILLVLVPEQRLDQLKEVWLQADEQIVDASTRRALARNGLRAGVIGPSPPRGLAEILQLDASPRGSEDAWQSIPLDKSPLITGHRKQLRPNKRMEIKAPSVIDKLPLFIGTDSGVTGDDFEAAQGVYALQWSPLPHGRIEIELTPELHHGRPRKQYAPGEGNDLQIRMAKSRKIFEELRLRVPLFAGQMLLISSDLKGSGSLGHHFHTLPTTDGPQHRIVLIRLAQVPEAQDEAP